METGPGIRQRDKSEPSELTPEPVWIREARTSMVLLSFVISTTKDFKSSTCNAAGSTPHGGAAACSSSPTTVPTMRMRIHSWNNSTAARGIIVSPQRPQRCLRSRPTSVHRSIRIPSRNAQFIRTNTSTLYHSAFLSSSSFRNTFATSWNQHIGQYQSTNKPFKFKISCLYFNGKNSSSEVAQSPSPNPASSESQSHPCPIPNSSLQPQPTSIPPPTDLDQRHPNNPLSARQSKATSKTDRTTRVFKSYTDKPNPSSSNLTPVSSSSSISQPSNKKNRNSSNPASSASRNVARTASFTALKSSDANPAGNVKTIPVPSQDPIIDTNTSATSATAIAIQSLYGEAKALEENHQYRQAALKYDACLRLDPLFGKCVVKRSMLEAKLRKELKSQAWTSEIQLKWQKSIQRQRNILRRGIRADTHNAILWQCWADLEKSLGGYKRARTLFRVARRADPLLSSVYCSWSQMEGGLKRHIAARNILLQGLRRLPENSKLYCAMGVLEDRHGNSDVARKFFVRGAKFETGSVYCLQGRAVLEYKVGNVPLARECFVRASERDPGNTLVWLTWAQMEEKEGQIANAKKCYQMGISAYKGNSAASQLWQSWARLEEKQRNFSEALNIYRRARQSCPGDVQIRREWAKLSLARGSVERARVLFREAILLDGSDSYNWQCLAMLEARQLNYGAARRVFCDAVSRLAPGKINASMFASVPSSWSLSNLSLVGKEDWNRPSSPSSASIPTSVTPTSDPTSLNDSSRSASSQPPSSSGSVSVDNFFDHEMEDMVSRDFASKHVDVENVRGATGKTRKQGLASLLYMWAMMEWKTQSIDRARVLFELASSEAPDTSWIWLWFARFEEAQDRFLVARNLIAKSIRCNGSDPDAWRTWSELERKLGRFAFAKECLDQAMQLSVTARLKTSRKADDTKPFARQWENCS